MKGEGAVGHNMLDKAKNAFINKMLKKKKSGGGPPGWEGTIKAMKKHSDIDNPWALAWYMKKKGAKPHYGNRS